MSKDARKRTKTPRQAVAAGALAAAAMLPLPTVEPPTLRGELLAASLANPPPLRRKGFLFGLTADPKPCSDASVLQIGHGENQSLVVAAAARIEALAGSEFRAQGVGVSYEEYVGSPKYSGNGAELTAESMWRVAWSDIENLYLILFPGAIAGIPQLPMRMPNSLVLRAANATFHPEFDEALITSNDGNNHYSHAKVTIQWKTLPFAQSNTSTEQIITRRISISGEFLTLPSSGLQWQVSGKRVNDDLQAGRVIPIIEHHLTLHRVPTVPYATIRSLIGHVNSSTFDVEGSGVGAAAETVLFAGAELQQTVTSDGTQPWQIEMHFQERRVIQGSDTVGWNHFFNVDTGEWEKLVTKSGDLVYPTGNLANLI